ncbi:MAG: glycosyltransferase family 9 protein, partial [Chloroflexota bacterium]
QAQRRLGGSGEEGAAAIPVDARILAIQPDHLGGMLLTTPALRLLKQAFPTGELTVLAGPWAADVPAHCPAVDQVRVCPFPGFERAARPAGFPAGFPARLSRGIAPYRLILDTAAALAEERYHVAITFHTGFWWGTALSALAGIPHRLGYSTPEAEPLLSRTLPLHRRPVGATGRDQPRPHVAELGLALARETIALTGRPVPDGPAGFDGRMAYEPAPAERAEAWRLWRANDLDEAPAVVAIHPSPGAPPKRWPPERFALLGDHLAGRYGARIVITGGPGDVEEARAVAGASAHRPVVLAGQTSFGTLAALFERCRFAAGTDNGAMHLATARGVPTLRLFGPIDPATWGGWPGYTGSADESPPALAAGSSLACAPCHRLDLPAWENVAGGTGVAYPCMRDVTVESAIAAAEALWSRTAGTPAA